MTTNPTSARSTAASPNKPAIASGLDAHAEAFARGGGVPVDTSPLTVATVRDRYIQVQRSHLVALPPTTVEERRIPAGSLGNIPVRILRPHNGGPEPLPIIFYFHGGGWVSGGVDTHDRLIRELAYRVSAAVVFVEYDLAPEKWYPVQNEQAYAALGQIVAMAGQLAFDASRIAVVGDDAGATIAIAVTLMTKQRRGPEIGFQLLFCPITGELTEDGSAHEFRDGPWLTRSEMQQRLGAIFPDPAKRAEATALPLRATPQQLNDLPPALVITAEWDIVRDQGEAYVRRLLEAGVDATATRYNGTIHDFVVLNALADSSATRGALAQATAALRNAFYGT